MALSSEKVEYMSVIQEGCKALWLCKMLHGLFGHRLRQTTIYCDNQSCIKVYENPVFHDHSKHIEVSNHFIKGWVQRGFLNLEYISIDEQVENIITKSLSRGNHVFFRDGMGVVRNTYLGKREH